jgi:hypothetical protein
VTVSKSQTHGKQRRTSGWLLIRGILTGFILKQCPLIHWSFFDRCGSWGSFAMKAYPTGLKNMDVIAEIRIRIIIWLNMSDIWSAKDSAVLCY